MLQLKSSNILSLRNGRSYKIKKKNISIDYCSWCYQKIKIRLHNYLPLILHAFKVLIIEEDNWYYINSFTSTEQRSSISFKASDWPIVTILCSHWLMTSSPRQYLRCVMQLLQYTVQYHTIHYTQWLSLGSTISHRSSSKETTHFLTQENKLNHYCSSNF